MKEWFHASLRSVYLYMALGCMALHFFCVFFKKLKKSDNQAQGF
ncbi:hypothetical protein TREAZ_0042 [Leadbettera azotonutricia ZAS-9]|uniref:Uncharacterized protein n=1 Tax=Leadbettera azotonutricia (strain ATCC BAA-888 / DSM 13862 / ZAS-9) TaxID=545695 RepID=F5YG39_LEAAZ|nr:hypothetical protein TREAZ_0042 [Leadbettera azotonutricia ZAS-9]